MGCPIILNTITQLFGIFQWAAFTIGLGYFPAYYLGWSKPWWGYVKFKTVAPRDKIIFGAMAALAIANTFASWRLWYCKDWDNDWVPLGIYFFMILVNMLWPLFINLVDDALPAIVSSFVGILLAITFTTFGFIRNDFWAGFVGVANIIAATAQFIIAFQIRSMPEIYSDYRIHMAKLQKFQQREDAAAAGQAPPMEVAAPPPQASTESRLNYRNHHPRDGKGRFIEMNP